MRLAPTIPDAPFTWSDAQADGLSRYRLSQLIETGEVRRVLHGVFVRADIPDTVQCRVQAAAIVMRPFTVLCDRTAAWLHGVDTFDYRELAILPPLECVALRDLWRTRRDGCAGGERDLLPRDICTLGPVRLTTPLRTALDLGCKLGRRDALASLDAFLAGGEIRREQLAAELPRYRGRRGVVQLRRTIPHADERSESPGESWTRSVIIEAGLPTPVLQHWVLDQGVPVFRLDLAYPHHKVAVEYDGRDFHDSAAQREADEARRRWLASRGWQIIVVTRESFEPAALAEWIAELRTALRLP